MRKNKIFILDAKVAQNANAELAAAYLSNAGSLPECYPAETAPEHPPEIRARAQQEVGDLFRYTNNEHPAMQELQRLCIERRTRQLARG